MQKKHDEWRPQKKEIGLARDYEETSETEDEEDRWEEFFKQKSLESARSEEYILLGHLVSMKNSRLMGSVLCGGAVAALWGPRPMILAESASVKSGAPSKEQAEEMKRVMKTRLNPSWISVWGELYPSYLFHRVDYRFVYKMISK
ncbi:hypothetical protein E1B28_010811 [Marasmius oreades]|uniref:Uncharacterized protein n=1 Tax=Marasmius oreades TaxID=181124 RepID=A0A9P7UNW6_9AGAR|nr:uncharacterized protein E1B28_010811 [Marasmius oreades]KAG7089102.1 hypothetical protein E1B28_010811 [Marasmius oreades]